MRSGITGPLVLLTVLTLCHPEACYGFTINEHHSQRIKVGGSWIEQGSVSQGERESRWSVAEAGPASRAIRKRSDNEPIVLRHSEAQAKPPGPPASIIATPVDSESIKISWTEPIGQKSLVHFYLLTWTWDRNPPSSHSPGVDESSYTLSRLIPYKEYSFSLSACLEIEAEHLCGQSIKASGRTHTAAPGQPKLKSPTITSNSIRLEWVEPDVKNGPLDGYRVRISPSAVRSGSSRTSGSQDAWWKEYYFTRNGTWWEGKNLNSSTNYTISVEAYNVDTRDNRTKLLGENLIETVHTHDQDVKLEEVKTTGGQLSQASAPPIAWIVVGVCVALALVAGIGAALWRFRLRKYECAKNSRRAEAEPSSRVRSHKEVEVPMDSSVNKTLLL